MIDSFCLERFHINNNCSTSFEKMKTEITFVKHFTLIVQFK